MSTSGDSGQWPWASDAREPADGPSSGSFASPSGQQSGAWTGQGPAGQQNGPWTGQQPATGQQPTYSQPTHSQPTYGHPAPYAPFPYADPAWAASPGWAPQPQQPQQPPPTRRRRRGPWIVLLLVLAAVALLVVALLAFAVGPRFARVDVLDAGAVEQGVTRIVAQDWKRRIEGVRCPAEQPVRPGTSFTCSATVDGRPQTVPVDVLDDRGAYQVGQPR